MGNFIHNSNQSKSQRLRVLVDHGQPDRQRGFGLGIRFGLEPIFDPELKT